MLKRLFPALVIIIILQSTIGIPFSYAAEPPAGPVEPQKAENSQDPNPPQTPAPGSKKMEKPRTFETLTAGAKKVEGLWTMYHKDQQLLVDLPSGQLDKDYVILTSIAQGISNGVVLGGMSWGFGDSVIWSFRKVGDKIHVLRRNVRFRATPGTPEADAVKLSYSDSVLYSLPILVSGCQGYLVDMTSIFMSDDPQIGRYIGPGFRYAQDRSTLAKVKSFPKNVEIQVASVYSGMQNMDTVSDPRGVQIHVHYSISMLPENGYEPRKADDRVGYFLTAVKDFSDKENDQNFVRYISRWKLKKKDPSAKLSPPEEPIVFYLEKTIPVRLRPYIQAGIEEWNKAFEKLGFSNAIVVLQQGDDEDWDPEDIRYNTFRWITADAGFAMGPARVNPRIGQILDADIIFDAGFLEYWKQDYETFTHQDVAALMGGVASTNNALPGDPHDHSQVKCNFFKGMQQQMGFAAAALTATGVAQKGELPEEFVLQALKQAVMHEVGHTLGLRHNFKASAWKSLKEIEAVGGTTEPTVASVMDYCPANIAPEGTKQGTYFSQTLGPYDYWAIEYGYKPIGEKENEELEKIAARGIKEGLEFATDEDTRGIDPDPLTNPFDLGNDPIAYAKRQMSVATSLLPRIVERTVKDGEGYQRARQAFGMLLGEYCRSAYFASRLLGGIHVHRDHKGDPGAHPPLRPVEASKQREAMQLLSETVFASPVYEPLLLNHLAPTYWSHWGLRETARQDYPIHDVVAKIQGGVLNQLLHPLTLSRLQDGELKVPPNEEAYTLAEHLSSLFDGVFTELKEPKAGSFENRKPYISSFRRNLQRMALKHFANLVSFGTGYPEDARTLARLHLMELREKIGTVLSQNDLKLDDYSKAHLLDSQSFIRQVLDAGLQLNSIT